MTRVTNWLIVCSSHLASGAAHFDESQEIHVSKRARRNRARIDERADSATSEHARETLPPRDTPLPDGATTVASPIPLKRFGRYEIVRELGHGAMGSVYLARDTQLRREVALKIPKIYAQDGPEFKERFHREARAAATLNHRNICAVHDIGEVDGMPYMTMAYIDGISLAEYAARQTPLSSVAVAELVKKLALALHDAHERGIIHRDLKPANILIDAKGEPVVMDFGLARQMNAGDSVRITHSGALLGSPAYMSPEQVEGKLDEMGPAADVYSLGVLLYELLAGELPFRGSVAVVIGQIVAADPPLPSECNPAANRRLEAICLKMMAKNPGDRYASMAAVAEAIDAFLNDPERDDGTDDEALTADYDAGSVVVSGTNLARGLAVLGLVFIDFRWAVASGATPLGWLNWLFERLDGRASALLVMLFGMGLSFASRRGWRTGDPNERTRVRRSTLIRAAILFVCGYSYISLWPGDLLHYCGAYLALGTMLMFASGRVIWTFAILMVLLFPGLFIGLEVAGVGYFEDWDREAHVYTGSSSFGGIVRNFFFNGFHPIVPWLSFFLTGMWLGRLNLQRRPIQYRLFWIAISVALAIELLSALNVMILSSIMAKSENFDYARMISLFGSTPWPPLPIFMLAAGSTAVVIVAVCLIASDRQRLRPVRSALADCGRLTVTLYVAHVVVGMGLLRMMGRLGGQTLSFALISAAIMNAVLIVFAVFWCRSFRRGPLEWLIWKVGG
jgi:uncharacterized membrane protein YeiB/tRNA A-37 threonylcarbamoyl transferase component Bud32